MAELELTEITIGYPKNSEKIALEFELAACKVQLQSGDITYWAEGTYEHPANAMSPTLGQENGTVKFAQDFSRWRGMLANFRRPPVVNLTLGKKKPFALKIHGGATEADYKLGGLPLTGITMKTGAGKFVFRFDEPNPETIDRFEVESGAASVEVYGLGNANVRYLKVGGGAASFKLDFSGEVRQEAEIVIETGLSSVELSFPKNAAVKIFAETNLGDTHVGGDFLKKDGYWINEAAISGSAPLITVRANVAVGSLNVKTV